MNDAALFRLWGPPCHGPSAVVSLYGHGRVTVAPAAIDAVRALSACYEAYRYVTRANDTGAFNCRDKVGRPGQKSVHALKIAIDTNWQTNPYGRRLITDRPRAMNDAIARIRTNSGAQVWAWGGDWDGNKDAMHNQLACSPRDLATGINPATLPSGAHQPVPAPRPTPVPAPIPLAPQPPAPSEEDATMPHVITFEFGGAHGREDWLAVGTVGTRPNCAINLNQATGEVQALIDAHNGGHEHVVSGEVACNQVKSFQREITFADLKAAQQ